MKRNIKMNFLEALKLLNKGIRIISKKDIEKFYELIPTFWK